MICRDIMSRPVQSVFDHESVQVAARRMQEANIGLLAVSGPSGAPLGVLTDRDLALRVCAQNLSPADTRVDQVMTTSTIACRDTDGIVQAEQLMRQYRKSRVLVLDAQGRLVGLISLSDIATHDAVHAAEIMRGVAAREVLDSRGARP